MTSLPRGIRLMDMHTIRKVLEHYRGDEQAMLDCQRAGAAMFNQGIITQIEGRWIQGTANRALVRIHRAQEVAAEAKAAEEAAKVEEVEEAEEAGEVAETQSEESSGAPV